MTKNKSLLLLSLLSLIIISCSTKKQDTIEIKEINTISSKAINPYLTQDHNGNAVLCWTELNPLDSLYNLKYAVYDHEINTFNNPILVTGAEGIGTSSESMNKIAFKTDGTIISVFSKKFENKKNPYAGAIYYNMSSDNGKSWTAPQFIHSDTSHHFSRNYFDITTLKSGEVAAIWLDGRYKATEKGLALFYSRTEAGKGFEKDSCIAKNTCECCRTEILTDQNGVIHLAYRNINFANDLLKKQERDIVYTSSIDFGKTFTTPKNLSDDHWKIEACPHTGPTLAVTNNNQLNAVWFTAGGNSGLYYTSSQEAGNFKLRKLITTKGKHPQIISVDNHKIAMVCEEDSSDDKHNSNTHQHSANSHEEMKNHTSANHAKIVLRVLDNGKEINNFSITDAKNINHHAVLTQSNDKIILAWINENNGKSQIQYTSINIKDI
jgi:hypothetical protein